MSDEGNTTPEERAAKELAAEMHPVFDAVRNLLPRDTHFSLIVRADEDTGCRAVAIHTDRAVMWPVVAELFLQAYPPTS